MTSDDLYDHATTAPQRHVVTNVLPNVPHLTAATVVEFDRPISAAGTHTYDVLVSQPDGRRVALDIDATAGHPASRRTRGWTILTVPEDDLRRNADRYAQLIGEALTPTTATSDPGGVRRTSPWILAGVVVLLGLIAAAVMWTTGSEDGPLTWQQAADRVGEDVEVRGDLVAVTPQPDVTGAPTFLNFGRPFPTTPRFDVVLFEDVREDAPRLDELAVGQTICVTGTVEFRDGVPQIVPVSAAQVVTDC